MKRLLLFDIDGTILRLQYGISRKIFTSILESEFSMLIPDSALPDFTGKTDLSILYSIAENVGISKKVIDQIIPSIWYKILPEFRLRCTPDSIVLLPGIRELINTLYDDNNYSLGLVTGNFKENAYFKLKCFDLDTHFPIGAFGSDHENRNMLPPIAIQRANTLLNTKYSSTNTIIIGDSPLDIECAKYNGIPVLAVTTGGFSLKELSTYKPDLLFNDLTDTAAILDSINNIL